MRGIRLSSVLGIIGAIYAIGFIIHYWVVFALILVAMVVWDMRKRNSHPARPASGPQAHYSNRR